LSELDGVRLLFDDEFDTVPVRRILAEAHIECEVSAPAEHSTIGVVERRNRVIQERIIMAMQAVDDKRLWAMAALDAVFKLNLIPKPRLNHSSPYHAWFGKPFDFLRSPLLPFGTAVMAHVPLEQQTKFGVKSIPTLAVGASDSVNHGILLFPNTQAKRLRGGINGTEQQ
jgi:hypothetical protein